MLIKFMRIKFEVKTGSLSITLKPLENTYNIRSLYLVPWEQRPHLILFVPPESVSDTYLEYINGCLINAQIN